MDILFLPYTKKQKNLVRTLLQLFLTVALRCITLKYYRKQVTLLYTSFAYILPRDLLVSFFSGLQHSCLTVDYHEFNLLLLFRGSNSLVSRQITTSSTCLVISGVFKHKFRLQITTRFTCFFFLGVSALHFAYILPRDQLVSFFLVVVVLLFYGRLPRVQLAQLFPGYLNTSFLEYRRFSV